MRIKELFGEPSLQVSVTVLTHKSLWTCCSDPLCPSQVTSIILELQMFQEEISFQSEMSLCLVSVLSQVKSITTQISLLTFLEIQIKGHIPNNQATIYVMKPWHGTRKLQDVFGQIDRLQNLQGLAIKFTEISSVRSACLLVRWAQSQAQWRQNVSLALRTTGFFLTHLESLIQNVVDRPLLSHNCDRNAEAQCIAIPRFPWSIQSQLIYHKNTLGVGARKTERAVFNQEEMETIILMYFYRERKEAIQSLLVNIRSEKHMTVSLRIL